MNSLFKNRVEVLTDVPGEKLDQVVADFQDSGSKVTYTQQPDGKYRIEAIFVEILDSPASGSMVIQPSEIRRKM